MAREAPGTDEGEAALSAARKEVAKEWAETLAEIARMDGEMEAATACSRNESVALEEERRAHEKADERENRITAQEKELPLASRYT